MKVKRYWKKILSLVLTSALLLGLLPTAAFAYSPDEKTDIIEFKAMVLENLTGGTVSEYQYLTTDNTFYSDINMNGYTDEDGEYGYSWTMLSYTIEKTQPVNLMLYRMNDDTEYAYGDTVNLTHSESPEADEPFIGEFIGYLHGTPLLDENGDKAVAAPLKSSLFGKEVGYDGLERHMERSAERFGKDDTRRQIRGRVDKALRGEPTEEELRERLRGARVDLYIRRNENGRIVGVTFIDHETRTVVNGSRLGKAYSANAFELRFGGKRNPGENTRGLSPKQAPAGRDGQRKRNTSRRRKV